MRGSNRDLRAITGIEAIFDIRPRIIKMQFINLRLYFDYLISILYSEYL
jgi:hypothetical protein